jgi:hypothetical protein
MTKTNKNDRSPRDISVPETMRIAALLAELMPPGTDMDSRAAPVAIQTEVTDSIDGAASSILAPPALQMEDLDDLGPAQPDDMSVTRLVDSPVESSGTKPVADAPAAAKLAPPKVDETVAAKPTPPKVDETVAATSLDLELIPLGGLTVAGYFSFVNWKNDPRRVRRPRRADFGLDDQTLAQASRNPFLVVGQPRRADERSVSEVMAGIVWE